MKEYVVIDHISEGYATCEREDQTTEIIALAKLPAGAKEQDWILLEDGAYTIDQEMTQSKKESNISLYKKLKKE